MIKVYISPQPHDFPHSGGVRTHLLHLNNFLNKDQRVELVSNPNDADILHVESAFPIPNVDRPIVYVCHGGFLPSPLRIVTMNLAKATKIVSVSRWIVDRFFPQHAHKTSVIPNGIDLNDFKDIQNCGLEPGFVLYGKDYDWNFQDFYELVKAFPNEHFVSTFWPSIREFPIPRNATYIGQQKPKAMLSYINDCKFLVMTGSEVCPTMLLEAWACGKPVFANGIDGNRELMRRANIGRDIGIGGWLYSKDTMLADFQEHLLDRKISEDGIPGIRKLVEQYDWNFLSDLYVGIYEELLS